MTKAELIELLAKKQPHLLNKDIHLAVKCIVDHLTDTLASGERIEIRGFGSLCIRKRAAQIGRNPKSGESLCLTERYQVHFKPGLDLREQVNAARSRHKIRD